VPAFNEEEALPGTLSELLAILGALDTDTDIVVVDDGSRDATAKVARQTGVVTLQLPHNTGVGGAVRTGLQFARDNCYERAVVVDADGQHDPRGIPALLSRLDGGADVVIGSRFLTHDPPYEVAWLRRSAMRFLALVVHRATGTRLSDVTSGYRAFSSAAVGLLSRVYPSEYLADTVEVLLIADWAGLRIEEVGITMRQRIAGVPSTRSLSALVSCCRLLLSIAKGRYRRSGSPGAERP
jgi:glycosyltransferase involved in cell wall biosynthesis